MRKPLDFFTRHPKCLLLKKRSLAMASIFGENSVILTAIRLEEGHGANPEHTYMHMSTQRKGSLSDGILGVRVDGSMLSLLSLWAI